MPQTGESAEFLKSIEKPRSQTVGGLNIFFGNIVSEVFQIPLCIAAQNVTAHARRFCRSSDFL